MSQADKNFENDKKMIEKDIINGRTDYSVFNYSLKEFLFFNKKD